MTESKADQDRSEAEDDLDFDTDAENVDTTADTGGIDEPTDLAEQEERPEEQDEIPVMERRESSGVNRQKRAVFSVPVEVTVSVGRAQPLIGDLLKMRRDALIPLDSKIEDPVELRVAGRVIARGELQEMDDGTNHLGVRLTEIIDMTDAL